MDDAVKPFYARRICYWIRTWLKMKQPKGDVTVYDQRAFVASLQLDDDASARAEAPKQAAVAAVGRSAMGQKSLNAPVRPTPSGASLLEDIRIAAKLVWFVASLRVMQEEALMRLFSPQNVEKKLLCVQPTGRGK